MKRLFFAVLLSMFLVFPILSTFAEELVIANQVTITWDEAKFLYDGELIPSTDTLNYRVYLADNLPAEAPKYLGETSDLTYTVTFSNQLEGWYYVGVQTVRRLQDGTEVSKSTIGWTNDPAIVFNEETFKIGYYLLPANATGLRIVGE